ncbi:hypothetical protein BK654_24365 [Pseudomonas brassicacearum]|nr:hypothetical protein BK654_24365 [Pseudomonas brassicacearum]
MLQFTYSPWPQRLSMEESGSPTRRPTASDGHAIRAEDFLFIPRRDGLVVQYIDRAGSYNNDDDSPDFRETSEAVEQLAAVMAGLRY